MFMNNQYGAMGYQPGAYQYAQPRKQTQWTNPLTPEKAKLLRKESPKLSLSLTDLDILKASCTHRDPATNTTTLVQNPDGSFTCTQCGSTFNIVEISQEDVERYVNSIVDILQSSKLMYVDMPVDAVETYYSMIPLLEKLPQLYTTSTERFKAAVGDNNIQPVFGQDNMNPFQIINQYMNPAYNAYYPYNQPYPQYTQPQQAPVVQQPMQFYPGPAVGGNPIQQGAPTQGGFAAYQTPEQQKDEEIRQLREKLAQQQQEINKVLGNGAETVQSNKVFDV